MLDVEQIIPANVNAAMTEILTKNVERHHVVVVVKPMLFVTEVTGASVRSALLEIHTEDVKRYLAVGSVSGRHIAVITNVYVINAGKVIRM